MAERSEIRGYDFVIKNDSLGDRLYVDGEEFVRASDLAKATKALERLIPWAEMAEDSPNMMTWSYDDVRREIASARSTLAETKHEPVSEEGKASG